MVCSSYEKNLNINFSSCYKRNFMLQNRFFVKYLSSFYQNTAKSFKLCNIIIKTPFLGLDRLPFARKTSWYGTDPVFAKFLVIHAALIFQQKVMVLHRDFLTISVEMDSNSVQFSSRTGNRWQGPDIPCKRGICIPI